MHNNFSKSSPPKFASLSLEEQSDALVLDLLNILIGVDGDYLYLSEEKDKKCFVADETIGTLFV